jgi:hypothetical protein
VLLFGPTPPSWWGPPARAEHRVLWTGHRGDPHGTAPDPGLLAISVRAVVTAVDEQLELVHGPLRSSAQPLLA